ncbi:hypothetical protein ACOMHN_004427 [Nucella lapillus]
MKTCVGFVSLLFLASVYDARECEEPAPVANAYRQWTKGVVTTTVTYECLETYELTEGDLTRTCNQNLNYTYTGEVPVCSLNCRAPRNETYAVVATPNGTHGLSRAYYECQGSFQGSGNTAIYCSPRQGAWNHSVIDCHDPANMLKDTPGLMEAKDPDSGVTSASLVVKATDGDPTTFVTLTPESTLTFNISQIGGRMGVARVRLTLRVKLNTNDQYFPCLLTQEGREYFGNVSKANKIQCQKWNSQTPHKHSFASDGFFPADGSVRNAVNYCRNPNGTEKTPWCYTSNKSVRNQTCNIEGCVRFRLYTVYTDMHGKERMSDCTDREAGMKTYDILDNVDRNRAWDFSCRGVYSTLLPFGHVLKLRFEGSSVDVSADLYDMEAFGRPYTEGCGPVRGYWRLELEGQAPERSKPGSTVRYRCREGWHFLGGELKAVCGDNREWTHPDVTRCTDEVDHAANGGVTVDVTPLSSGTVDLRDSSCDAVSLHQNFNATVRLTGWVEVATIILGIEGGNKSHIVPLSINAMNGTWSWACTPLDSASGEGTYTSSCPFRPVSDRVRIVYNVSRSSNPGMTWKICHIKVLGRVFTSALECVQKDKGLDYKGMWSVTVSGRGCQRWDSQAPHPHPYAGDDLFPDPGIMYSHNYCRNPIRVTTQEASRSWPWCYTTDSLTEWEYCPIAFYCDRICLFRGDGLTYTGVMIRAATGAQCINWLYKMDTAEGFPILRDRHFLTDAGRKCRNPHGSMTSPWCFTNRDVIVSQPTLCDIPSCREIGNSGLDPENASSIPEWLSGPNESVSVRECWSFPKIHPGKQTRFTAKSGLLHDACTQDLAEMLVFCDLRADNGSTVWHYFWYLCGRGDPVNVSQQQMEETLQKIKKELLVDTSTLSATKRKKESQPDSRPSAVTTGSLGVVFIVLVIGCIVGSDVVSAVRFIWQFAAKASKKPGSSSA